MHRTITFTIRANTCKQLNLKPATRLYVSAYGKPTDLRIVPQASKGKRPRFKVVDTKERKESKTTRPNNSEGSSGYRPRSRPRYALLSPLTSVVAMFALFLTTAGGFLMMGV